MRKFLHQKGALLVSAVVIIVFIGLLAATVTYIAIINARSTLHQTSTTKAYYLAESGLRRALYGLIKQSLNCLDINGDPNFTNVALGNGIFTVTAVLNQPEPPAVLTAAIGPAEAVLPISDLSNYATVGRVVIDEEAIDYNASSTDSDTCLGFPPCLTGLTRGAAGTVADTHLSGIPVTQTQCSLTATGGVPDLSNPTGKRQVIGALLYGYGSAWIVGDTASPEIILGWNGVQWNRMPLYGFVPDEELNGVYIITVSDAWAVGEKQGGSANINHWDGSTWTRWSAGSVPNKDLNGITCTAPNNCWAVGKKSDGKANIDHWDGTTWTRRLPAISVPNKDLNAVTCTAPDNYCWAVGKASGNALFVRYKGASWYRVMPIAVVPKDLNDVTCTSSTDCWAVGKKLIRALFMHWKNGIWTRKWPDGSVPNENLNGVTCTVPNNCWAVGDRQGGNAFFARWNGATWSRVTPDASVPNKDFEAVACASSDNCWAAGKNGSMAHWNGTQWTGVTAPGSITTTLNSIAVLPVMNTYGELPLTRE